MSPYCNIYFILFTLLTKRPSMSFQDYTDSKEIQHSQDVSLPRDQSPSEASFTMTMIKSFQASSRVRWMLYASILILVCTLGTLLTFWTPRFHQNQNTPILKLTFPGDKHISKLFFSQELVGMKQKQFSPKLYSN